VEEEIEEEELEDGIQSVDSISSIPTSGKTANAIDLQKQQRKEPGKPLYQVLEEEEERIAPGTGTQDKIAAAKRIDLLKGWKSNRVDVTL